MRIKPLTDDEWSRMNNIVTAVAGMTRHTVADVQGRDKSQQVAYARQMCCWALRFHTTYSWPAIGMFMKHDHTTVIHAYNLIAKNEALTKIITERVQQVADTEWVWAPRRKTPDRKTYTPETDSDWLERMVG